MTSHNIHSFIMVPQWDRYDKNRQFAEPRHTIHRVVLVFSTWTSVLHRIHVVTRISLLLFSQNNDIMFRLSSRHVYSGFYACGISHRSHHINACSRQFHEVFRHCVQLHDSRWLRKKKLKKDTSTRRSILLAPLSTRGSPHTLSTRASASRWHKTQDCAHTRGVIYMTSQKIPISPPRK